MERNGWELIHAPPGNQAVRVNLPGNARHESGGAVDSRSVRDTGQPGVVRERRLSAEASGRQFRAQFPIPRCGFSRAGGIGTESSNGSFAILSMACSRFSPRCVTRDPNHWRGSDHTQTWRALTDWWSALSGLHVMAPRAVQEERLYADCVLNRRSGNSWWRQDSINAVTRNSGRAAWRLVPGDRSAP